MKLRDDVRYHCISIIFKLLMRIFITSWRNRDRYVVQLNVN